MNFMETGYIYLDEDKKLYTPQEIPPLGEPLSIQSLCYWFTPTAASRYVRPVRFLSVLLLTIMMTLRSIPYLCLGLAECLILANQVLRR